MRIATWRSQKAAGVRADYKCQLFRPSPNTYATSWNRPKNELHKEAKDTFFKKTFK